MAAEYKKTQPGGFHKGHGSLGRHQMGAGEKAKDFKGTWLKLIRYCKKYLPVIVIAFICAIVSSILTLLGPNKLSDLTNLILQGIMTGIDMDAVVSIAWVLVAFYGGGAFLLIIQSLLMSYSTQNVSKAMRTDISKKINRLPMWYYNRNSTGDVLSRVTNDVDIIAQSLNQSIGGLITAITTFFGAILMMFITNWIMAITAIMASLFGFAFMYAIMGKSQKYFAELQDNLGALQGHLEEAYSGQIIIKAYNGQEIERQEFVHLNENMRKSAFKSQFLSGLMQPFMGFIGNFGYVAICVVGALLVQNRSIDFGVIVAFMIYVRLFTQPLSQLAQSMQTLQSAAAAGERVFDFIEAEEMDDESAKPKLLHGKVHGNVDFEHVRFGYEDSEKIVIKDFSAKVRAGQKIAIVGPTGAGKTTLVNLLMRFNELRGGKIKIDGVPIDEMSREELRNQFCMVLQDTWLFEGTIRENLIYNVENVPEEKIIRACSSVGLDHFIHTLPHGYETIINDTVNLSAGQKQQLTIARAMIADKPILILDEATSSIDTRTELKIQKAMDELMKGRTSFVIAHRLSTIKNADLILVLNNGNIVESGTHEELLKKDGFYTTLYNSQFEQSSLPS